MKRFKNILYVSETGVDQTPALARAVLLAKNNQADLTVADVIPEGVLGDAAGLLPDRRGSYGRSDNGSPQGTDIPDCAGHTGP